MDISQYMKHYGKLSEKVTVPVDCETKKAIDDLKSMGFEFNEWARAQFVPHLAALLEQAKQSKDAA